MVLEAVERRMPEKANQMEKAKENVRTRPLASPRRQDKFELDDAEEMFRNRG